MDVQHRFSFLELFKLWDGVASIPIGTQEQRRKAKNRILKLKGNKDFVRCFRDAPGFLMIAHRRKNLDDYFKEVGNIPLA